MVRSSTMTTGEVAELLEVAPRTVSKWFDAGKFPGGYVLPGSKDRRITWAGLTVFCTTHGIELPNLSGPGLLDRCTKYLDLVKPTDTVGQQLLSDLQKAA
jgi:hypothetical protein